jgi:hypothetical protein
VGAGRTAAVVALDSGMYALYLVERGGEGEPSIVRRLSETETWEDAMAATRELVQERDQILADRNARWRGLPASEKQQLALQRLGLDLWTPGMTKGEAAEVMTHEYARRAILREARSRRLWG